MLGVHGELRVPGVPEVLEVLKALRVFNVLQVLFSQCALLKAYISNSYTYNELYGECLPLVPLVPSVQILHFNLAAVLPVVIVILFKGVVTELCGGSCFKRSFLPNATIK